MNRSSNRHDLQTGTTMSKFDNRLKQAREISWQTFGKRITFYLPGMFSYNGLSGKYPAISITGSQCALQCDHCKAKILQPMISAITPDLLIEKCIRLAERGNQGVLISGGCDEKGRLPWDNFIPAIKEVKRQTELYISVHSGLMDYEEAFRLREAGVDQALIDMETLAVDAGVNRMALPSEEAIRRALDYGLDIRYQRTCCSISWDFSKERW